MSFAQFVHTTYEACMIAGFAATGATLAWKRRSVFAAVRDFIEGVRALVHLRSKLEFVVKELTPNGGASLKDKVNVLGNRFDGMDRRVDGMEKTLLGQNDHLARQDQHMEKQDAVLDEIRGEFKDLQNRFSRFVKHEADNDLHYSRLAEEERRRAAEAEKRNP